MSSSRYLSAESLNGGQRQLVVVLTGRLAQSHLLRFLMDGCVFYPADTVALSKRSLTRTIWPTSPVSLTFTHVGDRPFDSVEAC